MCVFRLSNPLSRCAGASEVRVRPGEVPARRGGDVSSGLQGVGWSSHAGGGSRTHVRRDRVGDGHAQEQGAELWKWGLNLLETLWIKKWNGSERVFARGRFLLQLLCFYTAEPSAAEEDLQLLTVCWEGKWLPCIYRWIWKATGFADKLLGAANCVFLSSWGQVS